MPQMLGGLDSTHPSTGPYRRQYKQLWDKASRWRTLWKDLVDFIAPDRGKYLSGESEHINDGAKRHENIINVIV